MIANFVMQTANAPGNAGTFNLIAPPVDRLSFVAAFGNGGQSYYFLDDDTQAEWGIGTVTAGSPDQYTRSTVIGNTAGTTARLNFSGSVRVYNDSVAGYLPYLDNNKLLTLPAGLAITAQPAGGMALQLHGRQSDNLAFLQFTDYSGATEFGHIYASSIGLAFAIGATTPLYLDASARVCMGNSHASSPSTALQDGWTWRPDAGMDAFCTSNVLTLGTTGLALVLFRGGVSATTAGTITTNSAGNTTTYGTSSDYRMKETFSDIEDALDRMALIPTYRGAFKKPPEPPQPDPETGELAPPAPWVADDDAPTQDMILAHELAEVVPEAVVGEKDAVDAAGNMVPQQVDLAKCIPLLIACVNELRAKVQLLEQGANAMSGTHEIPHSHTEPGDGEHGSGGQQPKPPKAPPADAPDHVPNPPGHPEHQGQ